MGHGHEVLRIITAVSVNDDLLFVSSHLMPRKHSNMTTFTSGLVVTDLTVPSHMCALFDCSQLRQNLEAVITSGCINSGILT